MTSKTFANSAWLALAASLLSGCQTSPVASIAPPAVTNAPPVAVKPVPAPPPLPTRSLLAIRPLAVLAPAVVVPPSFLTTISVSNSIGWGETNVFWWMGRYYGSHEVQEIAHVTNNFYAFSNQWDSRYPCFVSAAQFYTNGIVNGRKGYITNGVVSVSPFYFVPIVTSNIISPFVYLSFVRTNTNPLPVAHLASYNVWGVSNVNYQVSECSNLLGTFQQVGTFTGTNGPWSWSESATNQMFYRAVVR